MAAEVVRLHTIHRVLREFLEWRAPTLEQEQIISYTETLAFFEGSINRHAVRALNPHEKRIYRAHLARGRAHRRQISQIFGPEKIPGEMRYFLTRFLGKSVTADRAVLDLAPTVLADLCSWLVFRDYIPETQMERAIDELGTLAMSELQNSLNV